MPALGLDRVAVQRDFSAGMFRGLRPDLIPENGAYDISNGLLDDTGGVYRRGGSAYRSVAYGATTIPFLWDGFLGTGATLQRTLIASTSAFGLLNADGTVTSLGGAGLVAPVRPAAMQGKLYLPGGVTYDGATLGTAAKVGSYYAVVANRLLVASGDRVDFSDIGAPATFAASDFHQVPEGVQLIGLQGLRDSAMLFTTGGVWVIGNMGYDLTDAAGNVQHRVDRYSRDMVLWGDAGIAGYEGGLVVPALDGVWVVSLGVASEAPQAFRRVSDPIVGLYREYVRAGYQPGGACVYRGHYLLPIMSGPSCVDLLVCRLDAAGQPWSHLAGFGAKVATVAVRTSATLPRSPTLIAASAASPRVLDVSYFEPPGVSSKDADGSEYAWSVRTRDYATGALNLNTIVRLRMGYELGDDPAAGQPSIRATHISGRSAKGATDWGRFEWGQADWAAPAPSTLLSGQAPPDPYGTTPYVWSLAKSERFGRFLLDCPASASYLTLRSLEMFVRSNGRLI